MERGGGALSRRESLSLSFRVWIEFVDLGALVWTKVSSVVSPSLVLDVSWLRFGPSPIVRIPCVKY